uniref:C2H2-type domain-containing protein n=1 Tax=Amphiprion percula TaxID=161767 RepID=A0A3P8SXA2_AMPPE
MPGLQSLKAFISQRLTEAVDDILGHLDRTFREYEKETERRVQPTDFQQLLERKEDQEDQVDPELPHIKEEQEELWSSQEADITKFTFIPVKSEDDEEKPQSSQLHHSHTEENRDSVEEPDLQPEDRTSDSPQMDTSDCDWSGLNSVSGTFSCSVCGKRFRLKVNLKLHMRAHTQTTTRIRHKQDTQFGEHKCTTESSQEVQRTDGDDCGGSETTGRSDPVGHLHPGPAVSAEPQSGTLTDTTDRKPFSCLDCGKRFGTKQHLKTHMRCHIREKPFSCWVCKKAFLWSGLLKKHMRTHTHLSKTLIQTGDLKVVEVSPAQPEHLYQLPEKTAASALQRPTTSGQFPRPIMPKVPASSPLMAMPPAPAPFITPRILAPAGQAVRLVRVVLPMPVVPDANTGTEVASGRRRYRRTVAANTCRKCGQFRTADTGHSQYRGRVYCPRTEPLPKHQWLQAMRDVTEGFCLNNPTLEVKFLEKPEFRKQH